MNGPRNIILSLILSLSVGIAKGDYTFFDTAEWYETGSGTTSSGWSVSNITYYSKFPGAKFGTQYDYAISPCFSHAITQVVAKIRGSGANYQRFMTLTPVVGTGSAQVAVTNYEYVAQRFVWSPEDAVRKIRFQNDTGSGSATWGVKDVEIWTDRIAEPQELEEAEKWRNAFMAKWKQDPLTVSNEVEISEVRVHGPEYTLLKEWDFTCLTNTTGNTKDFNKLDVPDALQDVDGTNLCLQSKVGGHLQVGMSDKAGEMVLTLPSGGNRIGLLRLFKHAADKGADAYVVALDGNGVTNTFETVSLNAEPEEFLLPLSDGVSNLVVVSRSSMRVRVESVKIVSDYAAGYSETNVVGNCRTKKDGCVVRGLEPGDWLWRVRSFDAQGVDSRWSDYRAVELEPEYPVYREPGYLLLLR